MELPGTLLISGKEVASMLTIEACITAVEAAFRLHAEGRALPPKVMGIHTEGGGFHIKAGILDLSRSWFVAKINANFPANPAQRGLPTIQGIIAIMDGTDGRLLALIDSIEITIIRTGAATAVAAKYLALNNAATATICGCGNQGRISLKALMAVRPIKNVYAFDIDEKQAQQFSKDFSASLKIIPVSAGQLSGALKDSQMVITCTPSKQPFIRAGDIMPGTFIAAVGADSEEKQELFPDLLSTSKIVADLAVQSAGFGELHHAISGGLITKDGIHAELGEIIAGKKPGRESNDEIIVFDSTGTALQDIAAAAIVYEKASAGGPGIKFNF